MCLTDEQWENTGICSNFEVRNDICAANAKDHKHQAQMEEDGNQLVWSDFISRPIPRTEGSLQVKVAKKLIKEEGKKQPWTDFMKCLPLEAQ